MTLDTQASPLATLQSIGIINAEHHRRALADPHAAELDKLSSLSDHLIWLIGRDIVSDQDLRHACTHVAAVYSGEEQERYGDILEQALEAMARASQSLNHTSIGALRSAGLLTQPEHDLLLPKVPPQLCLATPAAAFAWIDQTGQLSHQRVLQIRRDMADGDRGRGDILRELLVLDQERKAALGAFWSSLLPGPLWMWIALPLLAIGLYIWHAVGPSAVPGCDDREVTRSLNNMMLMASIDARTATLRPSEPVVPTVVGPREVGYASETRVRGCKATLKADGDEIPYAYTIAGGADGKPASVTGASPAIVEARFGHLDDKGRFINNAAPIGRAPAESAFRAGVDQMMAGRRLPSLLPDKVGGIPKLAPSAPERTREIAEVEPVAPCRELKPGLAYSCRLLVERNDPLMTALGSSSSIELEGDFTFQRDSETSPWAMSEDFGKEFLHAVTQSRMKAVTQ